MHDMAIRFEITILGAVSPHHSELKSNTASESEKKRPRFLRRITGSFKSEPEPEFVTENKTRKREQSVRMSQHSLLIIISRRDAEWFSTARRISVE